MLLHYASEASNHGGHNCCPIFAPMYGHQPCWRQVNMASMTVVTSVYGVRPATAAGDGSHRTAAPAVQPGTGHLVLAAANTGLQFYDAVLDRHVSMLQVLK